MDTQTGRKLLFLKLELKDQNDHCYLIDILNKNHEAFCVFLILTTYKLTSEQIKKICRALESTKGIKNLSQQCTCFTRQIIPIKHSCATCTTLDEWGMKFESLFLNLKK